MSERRSTRNRRPAIPQPFRLFAAASGLSVLGDYLSMIALSLFAFERTGSALATGLLMALRLVAGLLVAPLAGRLVTRGDRRALLVVADVGQALAMAVLALLVGAGAAAVPAAFAASAITGVGLTTASVALRASIPAMVGSAARVDANSMLTAVRAVAMAGGFAAAGAILAVGGYAVAFALDAASFAVSAVVIAWLPLRLREPLRGAGATHERLSRRWRAIAGWRSAALRGAMGMLLVRTFDASGSGSHNVALPVWFGEQAPRAAARGYAGFLTAWALGNLLASTVVRRASRSWLRAPDLGAFVGGTCAMSALFVLAFVGWPPALLLAIAALAGAADGFTAISYVSRLQAVGDDERGRLFALSASGENGGLGLGMIAAALLLPALGPLATVGLMHGLTILAALALLYVARSR
ncbi:MAG TPA: MFS transporter [Conexibacter sp.]|jgi:MFS family permease|nr:MFS transporter [Conexibacter sp.]